MSRPVAWLRSAPALLAARLATAVPVAPPVYRRHQALQIAVFAVVAVAASAATDSNYGYGLLQQWAMMSIVCLGFYVAFALGGQFAFSQAAFMGLGGYAAAYVSDRHSVEFAFVVAVVVCAIVATAFALFVRKAHHFFFAIGTLALSELILLAARNWTSLTGPAGEVLGIRRLAFLGREYRGGQEVYFLLLGTLVVGLALVMLIERSPLRRDAVANRDNGKLAELVGVPVLRARVVTFVVGAAYAGAGGALFVHARGFAIPEAFGTNLGIEIFLIVLVGGLGSAWGPVVGAALVIWLREALRNALQFRDMLFGVLLIVLMIGAPEGVVGLFGRARDWIDRRVRRRTVSSAVRAPEASA